jgi:hypothetical protein
MTALFSGKMAQEDRIKYVNKMMGASPASADDHNHRRTIEAVLEECERTAYQQLSEIIRGWILSRPLKP